MHISRDEDLDLQIKSYEPGAIFINEDKYTSSIYIAKDQVHPWNIDNFSELNQTCLTPLLQFGANILLIGCGAEQQFLDPQLQVWLQQQGVGVEVMHTAAACRTNNVLRSEDRKVVAGFIL